MTTTTDDELLALAEAVLADPKNTHFDLLDATPPLEAYVDAVHPHRVKALVMRVKELEARTPLSDGWLPIVLCPTDGVERQILLPDGTTARGTFRNPPGRWRVWRKSVQNPPRDLEPRGGVVNQTAPYFTHVYQDLPGAIYPTHFRPNDTVFGPPTRAAGD